MTEWTLLCRTTTDTEAELVAGYLAGAGIETRIDSKRFRQYPVNLGQLGDVIVQVPAAQLVAAQELLAKLPQADDELPPPSEPDPAP